VALFRRPESPRLVVRELFREHEDPDQAAVSWTRTIAEKRELHPATDQLQLIRELRKADSGLSLEVATFMVQETAKES